MNLPKSIFFSVSMTLLFSGQCLFSQKDSTRKWIRFSANTGLIVNSTFSEFKNSQYDNSHPDHKFYVTKTKGAPEYSAGYSFGTSLLLGKSRSNNFSVGLTISQTTSQRHESMINRPHSLGPYYSYTHTELDFLLKTVYANLELGYKFRLFNKMFLQPSFVYHYNLRTKETRTGYMEVDERHSAGYQAFSSSFTTSTVNETQIHRGDRQGSFRISAFYQFNLNGRIFEVYAFKAWGINYHLPWGGLGLSAFF